MLLLTMLYCLLHSDIQSGPAVGKKAGPYTFLIATGPNRGTEHCYICETGDNPAVIILTRKLDDGLGKFVTQVDKLLATQKEKKLAAWVTQVGGEQKEALPLLVAWSKKHSLKQLPVGLLESSDGPPGYQLHKDAVFTILVVHQGKVVRNDSITAETFSSEVAKEVIAKVNEVCK